MGKQKLVVLWQRAKTLSIDGDVLKDVQGRKLWVLAEPPVMATTRAVRGNGNETTELHYTTNVTWAGNRSKVAKKTVELLPEFQEDVPEISFKEWLAAPKGE